MNPAITDPEQRLTDALVNHNRNLRTAALNARDQSLLALAALGAYRDGYPFQKAYVEHAFEKLLALIP